MLHPLSSFNAHSILVRSFNVRLFLESCSVAHSCSALCDPMDFSTPGFLVLYYLLELAQAHAHWVNGAIQPSHPVAPFSSWPQSFPASRSFIMCWLLASGGQSIGASASTSVLPVNIQGLFLLGLTGLISLMSKDRSMKRILFLLHPWLHPTTTVMF